MRLLALCMILLVLTGYMGYAETDTQAISFDEMERILDEANSDTDLKAIFDAIVSQNASFTPDEMIDGILRQFRARLGKASSFLKKTALYMVICAFISRLLLDGKTGRIASFIIHLMTALAVYTQITVFMKSTARALSALSGVVESVTPILVGLLALTGDTHFSAFVTPIGAFVSGVIQVGLEKGGMVLLKVYAALMLSGCIGEIPVKRLSEAVSSLLKWLIGSAMSLFLLLMATGGTIAGAYDGAFQKGLKFAADALIPIVGSDIAQKMDSITAGTSLIKSAAGVTGMAALLSVCLRPAMDAFINLWGLRFIACMLEPVSDSYTVSMLEGFSKVFSFMFALIAAGASMGILFLSAVIGIGRRVLG